MANGGERENEGLSDVVSRLIDDGKSLARAEIALVKAVAQHRADRAKAGAALLVAGLMLALSGFIALVLGIVLALAPLIGPLLAGLAILIVTGIAAFLLLRAGSRRLAVLAKGDEEERAAMIEGQQEAA